VGALGILFNIQKVVTREACFKRLCSHNISFLYCGVDISLGLAVYFTFFLYNIYVLNVVRVYFIQMHVNA